MRIFGQSTLANGMPYMHLGYIAAIYVPLKSNMTLFGGSLIAFVLGATMFISLVTKKKPSKNKAVNFMRRKPIMFLLITLAFIFIGAVGIYVTALHQRYKYVIMDSTPPEITLTLQAQKPETPLQFGRRDKVELTLENKSDRAVVVNSITPASDSEGGRIELAGEVSGSVEARGKNYFYKPMSQRQTNEQFSVGLLLPGERVTVKTSYRPLDVQEEFDIVCDIAIYDGTSGSLMPLDVFIRRTDDSTTGTIEYIPFTAERWKQIVAVNPTVSLAEAQNQSRAVIITNSGIPARTTARVVIPLATPLSSDEARWGVARRRAGSATSYCSALGGYVVFGESACWLLTSPDQSKRGIPLALFPPMLTADADDFETILVRVSDKQESVGADQNTSHRIFWEQYPVYYGDGTHTQGEFLHTKREKLKEFLIATREHKGNLGLFLTFRSCFFDSRYRYYILNLPPP